MDVVAGELDEGRRQVADVDRGAALVLEQRAVAAEGQRAEQLLVLRLAVAEDQRGPGDDHVGARRERCLLRFDLRLSVGGHGVGLHRLVVRGRATTEHDVRGHQHEPRAAPGCGSGDVRRPGGGHGSVGLDVGRVDHGIGPVLGQERVDRETVADVAVGRSDGHHVVLRGRTYDVPPEVAGASARDEQPHQRTR